MHSFVKNNYATFSNLQITTSNSCFPYLPTTLTRTKKRPLAKSFLFLNQPNIDRFKMGEGKEPINGK